jgi:hypothetical protein
VHLLVCELRPTVVIEVEIAINLFDVIIYSVLLTLYRGLAALLFNSFSLLFQNVISVFKSHVTVRLPG